jgi:hypothetical protein
MTIDSREARAALDDIKDMVARVRQSGIYEIASQIMIAAGVLVGAGNIANFMMPRYGGYIWMGINTLNVLIVAGISVMTRARTGVRAFDGRVLAAFLMFFGFGLLCTQVLGHFSGRQQGTFWPIYFMLFYSLAGLWFGRAFLAIGLSITALTLIGYFYIGGWAFLLWMAMVNGGGLILSGLWMRWGE